MLKEKQIKERMIVKAKSMYGEITPCDSHKDFSTCFTIYEGKLMFWFNDKTNNTKVILDKT